jgi:two-component system, LytTR family, response regulator
MKFTIFERNKKQRMLRTLIIDDEPHMRQSLEKLLHLYCPNVKVVDQADGVASGLHSIRKHRPDLVLLDIKLEDGTGFDLLRLAEPIDFKVIFITAYEQYALEAFRFSALDYLLKPIIPASLVEAVNKAEDMRIKDLEVQLNSLRYNMASEDRSRRKLVLKTMDNIHIVTPDEVFYCESDGNYTIFCLAGERRIIVSKTLREFEELLKHAGFFRVHKSFLVNLSRIVRLEKGDGGFLVISNGDKIPVGASRKDELMDLFEKL